MPIIDGEIVKLRLDFQQWNDGATIDQIPGLKWCEDMFNGDCQFDASDCLSEHEAWA
jgi:hypothetical protein